MGDLGISISYFAVGFFFIYYLTKIVGMDVFLAGLAFFIGKAWDGINDPLMGILSDRTRSKWGRKRIYILFGAIPFGISFILLWMIPQGTSDLIQFFLATLAMLLYGTAYTVVTVPYMAMVPLMSEDYDERTQITGIRAILSAVGSLLGGGAALTFDDTATKADQATTIRVIGIIFGVLSTLSLIIAAQSVKNVSDDVIDENKIMTLGLKSYIELAREKNVSVLMMLKFTGAIGTGILSAAIPFFADDVLGGVASASIGLGIYIVFGSLTIPYWNRLATRVDKRKILLATNSGVAIILAGIGFLVSEDTAILFYVGTALLGITMGSYLFLPYSLVPDLVDYYEVQNNERQESVYFGLWMTSHQLGIALAGLILGIVLWLFGYNEDAETQSNTTIIGVRIAFGLLPGIFLVLAVIILQKYEITKDVYQKVLASKYKKTTE
jgi:GPH family glycoside/pentoside/hexuronide:cation symporter